MKSPEAQRLASLKRLERQLIEAEKRLIQCGKQDLANVAKAGNHENLTGKKIENLIIKKFFELCHFGESNPRSPDCQTITLTTAP